MQGGGGGGAAAPADRPLLFASASADGTVRLWSAHCWSCMRVLRSAVPPPAPQPPVLSVGMSETYCAAGMPDGIVRLFSIDDAYSRALQLLFGLADCGGSSRDQGQPASKRMRLEGRQSAGAATAAGGSSLARPGSAALPAATLRLERELERALRSFIRIK